MNQFDPLDMREVFGTDPCEGALRYQEVATRVCDALGEDYRAIHHLVTPELSLAAFVDPGHEDQVLLQVRDAFGVNLGNIKEWTFGDLCREVYIRSREG